MTGFCQRMLLFVINYRCCFYMKASLPSLRSNPCRAHIYTLMQRHTAPPEYMDTMTGSTLAGPPLYLPIHPRFLSRVWAVAEVDTGWRCRRAAATATGGRRICLGRDRETERSLILQPSAACRPSSELSELCGLKV